MTYFKIKDAHCISDVLEGSCIFGNKVYDRVNWEYRARFHQISRVHVSTTLFLISTQINLVSYLVSLRTVCKYDLILEPIKEMLRNKA